MKRLWAPLLLLLVLFVPFVASAQSNLPLFDPEWQLVPEASEIDSDCPVGAPLGFGGVLQLIQNVMNAAISFGVLISVLVIAGAGILWILTPTNPENHSQAKKILTNAVIGLLIILSAWLIVDFVMKLLYSGTNGQQGKFGPWNQILTGGDICIVANENLKPLFEGDINSSSGIVTGGGWGGSGSGSGGSCTVPTRQSNACSVTSLQGTCFGPRASDASRVCMLESANGRTDVESGSDLLNSGRGPSYSIGLWQINLTTTPLKLDDGTTLNCPAAFRGLRQASNSVCGGGSGNKTGPARLAWCTVGIKDQALYDRCVAAAKRPSVNTRAACELYNTRLRNGNIRGLQPWLNSANKCNVPFT